MKREQLIELLSDSLKNQETCSTFSFLGFHNTDKIPFIAKGVIYGNDIRFTTYSDNHHYMILSAYNTDGVISIDKFIKFMELFIKDNRINFINCPFIFSPYAGKINKHNCKISFGYKCNITRLNIKDNVIDFRTKAVKLC